MKRKVVKHGPSSLTVSLPMKWAKQQGIKAGDEIDISEEESELVISKEGKNKVKETEIRLTKESERYIRSYLGKLYRAGYSEITLFYDNPDCIRKIREAVNTLLGADILETEANRCLVKVFTLDDTNVDFDKNLVKMLMTLKAMLGVIKEDVSKGSFSNVQLLEELRQNNWRMRDLIQRNEVLQGIDYERMHAINAITFFYEKASSKLNKFYKTYLVKAGKIRNKKRHAEIIDEMVQYIDWHVRSISGRKPLSMQDGARIRHKASDFSMTLLQGFPQEKGIDHAFLTTMYFITEIVDSAVTYHTAYRI
ncbi:AbrB/MazE/SpoVT family DNA-binding domain-containing protein [Thermoproteota archaeon]